MSGIFVKVSQSMNVNSGIAPFEDAMESYLVTDFRRQFFFIVYLAVNSLR